MTIKIGDTVKFKPELFEDKRKLATLGGIFCGPIDLCEHDEFKVLAIRHCGEYMGEPDLELCISNYPWLVWADEIIKIDKPKEI